VQWQQVWRRATASGEGEVAEGEPSGLLLVEKAASFPLGQTEIGSVGATAARRAPGAPECGQEAAPGLWFRGPRVP